MKASFPILLAAALLSTSLLAAPPDEAKPNAPAVNAEIRLKFQAYDEGDTGHARPRMFQIDNLDIRQPTEFLKIGEMIQKTQFKLTKFVYKTAYNPKIESEEEVSELTIVNTTTKKEFILILAKVTTVR